MLTNAQLTIHKQVTLLRPDDVKESVDRGIRSLAFSRDGRTLASGCENGHVMFWDVLGLKLRADVDCNDATLAGDNRRVVRRVAYSPDGRVLAVAGGRIWHPKANKQAGILKLIDTGFSQVKIDLSEHYAETDINALAFAPGGEYFAVGDHMGRIALFNPEGQELKFTDVGWVHALAFTPTGNHLIAAVSRPRPEEGEKGKMLGDQLVFFDMPRLEEVFRVDTPHTWTSTRALAVSPTFTHMATVGSRQLAIYEMSKKAAKLCYSKSPSWWVDDHDYVEDVTFTKDGEFVVTAGGKGGKMWDAKTGEEVIDFFSHYRTHAVACAENASMMIMATGGGTDREIALWRDMKSVVMAARILNYGK